MALTAHIDPAEPVGLSCLACHIDYTLCTWLAARLAMTWLTAWLTVYLVAWLGCLANLLRLYFALRFTWLALRFTWSPSVSAWSPTLHRPPTNPPPALRPTVAPPSPHPPIAAGSHASNLASTPARQQRATPASRAIRAAAWPSSQHARHAAGRRSEGAITPDPPGTHPHPFGGRWDPNTPVIFPAIHARLTLCESARWASPGGGVMGPRGGVWKMFWRQNGFFWPQTGL